jgi:hypothetical protein
VRYALVAVMLAASACSASSPAADSTKGVPAVDSAAPETTPAATTPAPATPRESTPESAAESTPGRPGLTPRRPHPVPRPMPPQQGAAAQDVDQAALDRLTREVKALARADGCTAANQCRTLPIGARPCGGPEEFVVYCPRTTDVAALERKAAELERAQKAFNEKSGLMSTCEMRMPPRVVHVGGACRAANVGLPNTPAVPVP